MADNQPQVLIMMGSDSDWPVLKNTADTLDRFSIHWEAHVASAHRTPARAIRLTSEAEARGIRVIVAAAGMAAHLAGVIAAHTPLPVIGVPMPGGILDGLDALLSTVQMPGGVPVATVAVGKAGAVNAAVLAARILALGDPGLKARVEAHREEQREKVEAADARLAEACRGAP